MGETDGLATHGANAAGTRGAPASAWLPRAARAFRILAVLTLPGLFVKYALGNLEFNDFSVYYTAARAVLGGVDPYAVDGPSERPFVYPPGFAVLLTPLALLPYSAAAWVWSALSIAAIFASLWLCLDALGIARGTLAWVVGGLTLLCSARMLDSELGNGQANHWVLLGIAASVWLVARGRAALGGVALAFAIVAKVTPVLLVLYYVARRRFRVCVGVAAGLLVLDGVLPALALGPQGALNANLAWAHAVVRPVLPAVTRPSPTRAAAPRRAHGYSLRAFAHRHLTRAQAAAHHDEPVFVNAVAWSRRSADAVYYAAALLALAATAFALGSRPPRDASRWLLEVACVATTMVLVAPLSRKAHFVILLLPFACAAARVIAGRSRAALVWVAPPALVFGLTSPGVLGDRAAALALAWGAYTLATLWLWAGALHVAWRDRRVR